MVSLSTESRPACTGADESTARRIDARCRIDAHRTVVYGVLQVRKSSRPRTLPEVFGAADRVKDSSSPLTSS